MDEALKHADANLATKKEIIELQEHLLKLMSDEKVLMKSHEATIATISSHNSALWDLVEPLQKKIAAQRVEADLLREELRLAMQGGAS